MRKFAAFISILAILVTPFFSVKPQIAKAGHSDYIAPYFSAYFADETQGQITAQNNVFDMSAYTSNLTGKFPVITSYTIENVQENAEFCYPVLGSTDNLADVKISINGTPLQTEILYGDTPYYFAGNDVGHVTVQDAIASVKPTEIADGIGVLYTFEANQEQLTYSFTKTAEQTVFHDGTNHVRIEQGNYEVRLDNTLTTTYRLFVIGGDLQNLTANVLYTRQEITYKAYADYYLDELLAELGEQYRGVCYSRFNRSIDGSFYDVSEILYNFNNYGFALIKTTLPQGTVNVTVNSYITPLVNALYKPTIYLVRAVAPYPSTHATTTQIKLSEALPYIIESNVEIENNVITAEQMKDDFYYVFSSEKKPQSVLNDNTTPNTDKRWIGYLILSLCGCAFIGIAVWVITEIKKSR